MKKVLALNFFPAFTPPSSGGELRYFHLYNALSQYYDVTLLSPTYGNHASDVVVHSATFREQRVPKEDVHTRLHIEMDTKGLAPEVSALVCSLSARYPNKYHDHYLRLYAQADIIVHDHPFMCEYDLFLGSDTKPRIYNSHNYEAKLFEKLFQGPHAAYYVDHIRNIERTLCQKADLVLAISEEERVAYIEDFGLPATKVKVAPNGIVPEEFAAIRARPPHNARPKAFFIGSAHHPNVAAAAFIADQLAAECGHIDFVVAGGCTTAIPPTNKPNVTIHGRVNEEERRALFASADIALNTLTTGGGSCLKTLEFLSSGLPLVSTAIGVRGINIVDGQHYFRAELVEFAAQLKQLVQRPERLRAVALEGRELANREYSWSGIANSVRGWIEALPRREAPLVVLNDFEVSEPSGGGQARINNLYGNLSAYRRVLLVCLNDTGTIRHRTIRDQFVELSLPKTEAHLRAQRRLDDGTFIVSVGDVVSSEYCSDNALLCDVVAEAQRFASALVLSHPYMVGTIKGIAPCPVVYESLNHELALKTRIVKGHSAYEWAVAQTAAVEHRACRISDLIVTVSDEEQGALLEMASPRTPPVFTVANGVVVDGQHQRAAPLTLKATLGGRPLIVFIGSGHKPNITAMRYIIHQIAPKMPDHYFGVMGSVCGAPVTEPIPDNVLLFGIVGDEEKALLLQLADIGINPMEEGAGSNLKLAEYLASRLPAITTPFGARGYDIKHEDEALIVELEEFPAAIRRLQADTSLRHQMTERAFHYARRALDWRTLARRYHEILTKTILPTRPRPRVLVLTYRMTDPPLGGAEQFALRLLQALDQRGELEIEIATLDVGDISNRYHFGVEYGRNSTSVAANTFASARVRYFATDQLPANTRLKTSRELFSRWNEELRAVAIRHMTSYRAPLLMGGWSPPETQDGKVWVWSSGEAHIYVRNATELTLEGFAPQAKELFVSVDGKPRASWTLNGYFDIKLDVSGGSLVALNTATFTAPEDPRELGVRISRIQAVVGDRTQPVSLDRDFRWFLKEHALGDYVDSMIANAEERAAAYDDMFQAVRGPWSKMMDEWLSQNASSYDLIIGHSLPFRTSVVAADQAKLHSIPYVVIPHMHFEDDYYHWRSYYRSLQAADAVISSAKSTTEGFYSKIGAHAIELHGGLDANEYETSDVSAFRQVYPSTSPFVLVLGRKDGPKNYRWTIDAVAAARKRGVDCELVMIGRDEDHLPVRDPFVSYLGEQPRAVVLGALRQCACLVHMSESESFGLVVLEAWMMARPVIVNGQCRALADLVDDGANGRKADQNSLADTLVTLLQDPSSTERLGAAGKQKARAYTWDRAAETLSRLIQDILDQSEVRASMHRPPLPFAVSAATGLTPLASRATHPLAKPPNFSLFHSLGRLGTLVSVGAGTGMAAVSLHFACADYDRIVAFESDRKNEDLLRRVSALLPQKKFEFHMTQLGRTNGRAKVFVPCIDGIPREEEASFDNARFEQPWIQDRLKAGGGTVSLQRRSVDVRTFDSYGLQPAFVNITAAGNELAILEGMTATIQTTKPIFMLPYDAFGDAADFLGAFGYEPFAYDERSGRLVSPCVSSGIFFFHRKQHGAMMTHQTPSDQQ